MFLVIMIMGIFHVSCVCVVDTILINAVEVAWIVVLVFALAFALFRCFGILSVLLLLL